MIALNKLKLTTRSLMGGAMLCLPAKVGAEMTKTTTQTSKALTMMSGGTELPYDSLQLSYKKAEQLAKKLPRTFYPTNSKGGITEFFEIPELRELRSVLLNDTSTPKTYSSPIPAKYSPRIDKEGNFGAQNGLLPHLGVKITINDTSVNSIPALSPVDGIIVSQKTPDAGTGYRETKIMGRDGKIYALRFFSTAKEYTLNKFPAFKKIGSTVNQKDTVGFIRKAPNGDRFDLQLRVEDLDEQKRQLKNPLWRNLNFVGIEPLGQINPLSAQAGGISKVLNQYQVAQIETSTLLKLMYAD